MRFFVFGCGLIVCASSAFGGEKMVIASPQQQEQKEQVPTWSFDLNSDYTFGSKIMKSADFGSQAVYHYEIEALRNFHLFGKYYFQVGVDAERFDFSRSNNIFPYAMSSLAAELDVSYWSGDDFHPLIKLEPGVYFTRDHITANSFNIPIRVVGGIKIRDNVHLVLGIDANPFEEDPVIPIGGINWKINDKFTLRAVFPEPKFSYNPNKALEFFLAADFAGGAYRNGPTNDHRTNNALLAYTEYRAGAGINYTPKNGVSLQFTAGWTFERRIDYFRAGPDNTAKGAPYLKLDLSIALF
jgi:hypothetical protein